MVKLVHDVFQNPLMNPALVLDHPTGRQDQILMQLSTLKQVWSSETFI